MPSPVKIVAILVAHPGKADDLKTLLDGLIAESRKEAGNLRFDLWHDRAEANRFVLDELYVDAASIDAHRQTPHFQNYLSKIGDLADRTAIVLDGLSVA